jgi:hypothetical protein
MWWKLYHSWKILKVLNINEIIDELDSKNVKLETQTEEIIKIIN